MWPNHWNFLTLETSESVTYCPMVALTRRLTLPLVMLASRLFLEIITTSFSVKMLFSSSWRVNCNKQLKVKTQGYLLQFSKTFLKILAVLNYAPSCTCRILRFFLFPLSIDLFCPKCIIKNRYHNLFRRAHMIATSFLGSLFSLFFLLLLLQAVFPLGSAT